MLPFTALTAALILYRVRKVTMAMVFVAPDRWPRRVLLLGPDARGFGLPHP